MKGLTESLRNNSVEFLAPTENTQAGANFVKMEYVLGRSQVGSSEDPKYN